MKTTRVYATACLFVSSVALIAAANLSFGDEPGVTRLSGYRPQVEGGDPGVFPAPVPDASGYAGAPQTGEPVTGAPGVVYDGGVPMEMGDPMMGSPYPQPGNYAPYFDRSFGATEMVPEAMQGRQPFGPILMFEQNIDDGLGYDKASSRLNARIPYHLFPNTTVMMADLSAAVTSDGSPYYNYGLVYRNYDAALNRIFGVNAFGDFDEGFGNRDWNRVTVGFESLGKYIDWRANGYLMVGEDSVLLSTALTGDPRFSGNNVLRNRQRVYDNAYSGFDIETGGPLPLLGRYGLNMYAGAYVLGNSDGYDTVGFQARWQALVTESLSVNTYLTTDDTFGTNSWVSLAYTIPNYRDRRFLKPTDVRERLQDPVMRSNRIHTNIDTKNNDEALLNKNGLAYTVMHVDPNQAATGTGTFENPYNRFQLAANNNNALIDTIYVTPLSSQTSLADVPDARLAAVGGITLFDCQTLMSSTQDLNFTTLDGTAYTIPRRTVALLPDGTPDPNALNLGALISDPNMLAGGSVVRLANQNTILGMRIDASNAANTVFGTGVSNANPITDVSLLSNRFTDYVVGANLQNVQGTAIIRGTGEPIGTTGRTDRNEFIGRAGTSQRGLVITSGAGKTLNLLVQHNEASGNSLSGLSITAKNNSTINADNPNGFSAIAGQTRPATGILDNVVTNNGDAIANTGNGIEVLGKTGSRINAVIEGNNVTGSINNGLIAETDGGIFRLASLRDNRFIGTYNPNVLTTNNQIGAFLHYKNGGLFSAISEDRNEDLNLNGILDAGEDTDADGVLDVANNTLDAGEDLNGNGILDQGIVSNEFTSNAIAGLCIIGDGSGNGNFMIGGPRSVLGNTVNLNGDAGVAVDLNGTATASIDSMFNTIQDQAFRKIVSTRLAANFSAAGDTFDAAYGLTNNSPAAKITRFNWDVSSLDGSAAAFMFDTTSFYTTPAGGSPVYQASSPGRSFVPLDGSEIVTGLLAINGVNVQPFPDPNNDDLIPDRSQAFQLDFTVDPLGVTGFDGQDALSWQLDVDPLRFFNDGAGNDTVVNANQLAGSTASVRFLADFNESGTNSFRTLQGQLVQSSTNAEGVELVIDQTINTAVFDGGRAADGFRVRATQNAVVNSFRSVNDNISRNGGAGLSVIAGNDARVNSLTVQGATLDRNNGRGLNLEATENAVILANNTIGGTGTNVLLGTSFNESNNIRENGSDGIRARVSGAGVIRGNVIANRITDNGGNGVSLVIDDGGTLSFGDTPNNQSIRNNTITGNGTGAAGGAGVKLTSNVSATTVGTMNAIVQGNTISNNTSGGIVSEMTGPNNVVPVAPSNNVLNLTVGGALTTEKNTLANNGDVGVGVQVTGNGLANVNVRNAEITGTTDGPDALLNGDGINLRRSDSSLLLATIEDVTATGNSGDGLDVDVQGNGKNDVNQPLPGTANNIDWRRNNFSNNGGNGASFRTRGDAVLIAGSSEDTDRDGILDAGEDANGNGVMDLTGGANNLSNNGQNGVLIRTSEASSFGDPTDGVAPGRRSVLDGNTISRNGVDGIQIVSTETSQALVEINSTRTPLNAVPHGGANNQGNTSISNNGRDGIRIDTTGGRSDILVTSSTGQTTIDGNGSTQDIFGTATGSGNGIRLNASGTTDTSVRVTRTIIRNSQAGASEDVNGNGVLDAGEDLNGNEDIDVVDGDGIQANFDDNTTATLIVGGVGDGNIIQSNEDDGIAIRTTGEEGVTLGPIARVPRPVITIVDNTIGGLNNAVPAGNLGDGISVNLFGGADVGVEPGNVDFTTTTPPDFSDTTVTFNGGETELGGIPRITIDQNSIMHNQGRGANVLLTGAGGIRDRSIAPGTLDLIEIDFTNNTISSNGEEGIFYRADSNMNQSRFVYLPNFPNPPLLTDDNQDFTPGRPEFMALNAGSVNGNTEYMAPYLNLRTVQNSYLTVTGNTIQNNGTKRIAGVTDTGEGLYIKVGTGAYVAADVQGNTFGGNLEADFRTGSFLSAGETFTSVDNSGAGTRDFVYLDDTAQLDVRFLNNTGNLIDASARGDAQDTFDPALHGPTYTADLGATYTLTDPLKEQFFGSIGVQRRRADLFQVENGANLNDPNNLFRSSGVTQNIHDNFSRGGLNYNVRAAADALFPNIGFAPFLP